MVAVPAGDFIYQSGQKRTLPTFYIDKYEVTFRQYHQFLDALAKGDDITVATIKGSVEADAVSGDIELAQDQL